MPHPVSFTCPSLATGHQLLANLVCCLALSCFCLLCLANNEFLCGFTAFSTENRSFDMCPSCSKLETRNLKPMTGFYRLLSASVGSYRLFKSVGRAEVVCHLSPNEP